MATDEEKRRAQSRWDQRRAQGIPIGGPDVKPKSRVTVELKEGYVALAITHRDYFALMATLRERAEAGDAEAQRLIPILRVEGLEPAR